MTMDAADRTLSRGETLGMTMNEQGLEGGNDRSSVLSDSTLRGSVNSCGVFDNGESDQSVDSASILGARKKNGKFVIRKIKKKKAPGGPTSMMQRYKSASNFEGGSTKMETLAPVAEAEENNSDTNSDDMNELAKMVRKDQRKLRMKGKKAFTGQEALENPSAMAAEH